MIDITAIIKATEKKAENTAVSKTESRDEPNIAKRFDEMLENPLPQYNQEIAENNPLPEHLHQEQEKNPLPEHFYVETDKNPLPGHYSGNEGKNPLPEHLHGEYKTNPLPEHYNGIDLEAGVKETTTIESVTIEKNDMKSRIERFGLIPRNGGEWSGESGNSDWRPNCNVEPGDRNGTNPDHKTWGEIMDQYGIESIPFNDGEPDFSKVSKGEVEIDDFSDDRDSNFSQADEKLAEQRGCTPEEVAKWREENKYTWHECRDCKTMQKVPTEVHGNISHSGGISEYKSQN